MALGYLGSCASNPSQLCVDDQAGEGVVSQKGAGDFDAQSLTMEKDGCSHESQFLI
jgi:hypothetical protein